MLIPPKLSVSGAIALACAGLSAGTAAADTPNLRVSGFGSATATKVNVDGVEYVNSGQSSGAGRDWSFKTDSRLGVQFDGRLNERFSGTLQLFSKHSAEGNSRPVVEWAFGRARLSEGLTLRLGRMGAPFYAVSDFREVGYANTWLRTPTPVYGQNFFRTFDGVDLSYSGDIAGMALSAQLLAGQSKAKYEREFDTSLKRNLGLNVTLDVADGVTLRAGAISSRLNFNIPVAKMLLGIVEQTPFASAAQGFDCVDSKALFGGLGITVDRGNWVGSAEYTLRRAGCFVSNTNGWHVMGGYRIGKFTPYAVYARTELDGFDVTNPVPKGVAPQLDSLSYGLDMLFAPGLNGQKSTALGVRWDAWKDIAVKAQWERIDTDGGPGFFRVTGQSPSRPVNALSVGIDFVF